MKRLLKDLFYGPGNHFADLGRILSFVAVLALLGAAGWNIYLGQPLDLGPNGLGGGLGGILLAGAAFLGAKAWERRQQAKSENEATVASAVAQEERA